MKDYIIETKHLTKIYGEQKIVSDLNMHVRYKSIYGLLGRNGAGKTTTMKMLLNLTSPTSGDVYVFGKKMKEEEKACCRASEALLKHPGFIPI